MVTDEFTEKEAATEKNPKWDNLISRKEPIYTRPNDVRSEFKRDYDRILHSTAISRLKHKTQVFYAPVSDHVCTRAEHVNHVADISQTISKELKLDTELTNAIAIGHDIGHAPFGHAGENTLKGIAMKELGDTFWHEKNSLWYSDSIETLPDDKGNERNLNLTYAVRDGIISHCGEVNDEAIIPRDEFLDLFEITEPNQVQPYTWEGCVVKVSDKIAFLGRDIEDAIRLRLFETNKEFMTRSRELESNLDTVMKDVGINSINNTALIHCFVVDVCRNSNPERGIQLSAGHRELMRILMKLSIEVIYKHQRLKTYEQYAELIINSIFQALVEQYSGNNTIRTMRKNLKYCRALTDSFPDWLTKYSNIDEENRKRKYLNRIVYDIEIKKVYVKAIIDYISGMSDHFALKVFSDLTSFS